MRMSDLAVDAPLAAIEDDVLDFNDFQGVTDLMASLSDTKNNNRLVGGRNGRSGAADSTDDLDSDPTKTTDATESSFTEPYLGGSLEDLVSNFDDKIAQCLQNLNESTERIAPVQVRTQEEIMNESQIWWTLTCNFGNILPIDWSKSYARKLQLPALRLQPKKKEDENRNELDLSDDEELAQAFDLHSMIVTSANDNCHREPPPQTADEVIEEIDEIMQQSITSEMSENSDFTMDSFDSLCSPLKSPSVFLAQYGHDFELESRVREATSFVTSGDNMKNFSYKKLVVLHSELESLIQIYNETLVQELASRDELEYEKELKNTFISLLLSIQNKRRQYHMDKKRKSAKSPSSSSSASPNGVALPQYLTAAIPYREGCSLDGPSLQALIKILRAVNENSMNVPNMLTDYILNVFCPSAGSTPTA